MMDMVSVDWRRSEMWAFFFSLCRLRLVQEHKVLLTGTPLQNTVEELFSLLNFLEPERFPSEQTFMTEFGDLKTEEQVIGLELWCLPTFPRHRANDPFLFQVQKLQGILKPMMLRRLKEDVEKNLAPKEETIIEVRLALFSDGVKSLSSV